MAHKSATLTDNILINYSEYKCVSDNITSFISDHLPQFIIFENFKAIASPKLTIKLCSEISRISIWMPLKETLVQETAL